ncbi:uncharacterized protein C8R40DRAFT_1019301, partial [Lentinula edodes]|uniref:uncharacterized protein n=1 Tax=Lentinula edodes TaxID=5353 RepID=UPI001E8DC176
ALCVADYIKTWPRDFSSIWKRKLTGTSVLFLVNRYMLLLSVMIQAIPGFPGNGTDEQCQALNIIYPICGILALVATNVLFALRVYAIYSRNKVIFGIASAFIISRFTLDIWSTVLEVSVSTIGSPSQNLSRCGLSINNIDQYTQLLIFLVELAIPLLALGYDIFIFILTAIKTVQHSLEMQRLNQSSITQIIILRKFKCMSLYPKRLPNILISRLMLNLRTYSEPGNTTISQGQQTRVSSLNFASNQMLGNIGAPLDGRSFNEEEEEE